MGKNRVVNKMNFCLRLLSILILTLLCACGHVKSDSHSASAKEDSTSVAKDLSVEATSLPKEAVLPNDSISQVYPMEDDEICELPDMLPSFPGGDKALAEYIGTQLNDPEYSRKVRNLGNVRGDTNLKIVVARFVVDIQGEIRNAKVVRSVDSACDKRALDIISKMPKWIPAQHKGEKVASYYTMSICFDLK